MIIPLLTFFGTLVLATLLYLFVVAEKVPKFSILGTNAIVTGGSEGLGLEIAINLVKKGANVVIISRNIIKLGEALAIIGQFKIKKKQVVNIISADVTDPDGIRQGVGNAVNLLGGSLNLLVNNAGITHPSRFEDLDIGYFKRVMEVNYFGNVYTIRAALPFLKKQKWSRVIGISSLAGLIGIMGYSCYSPSKAAIRSLYESLHQECYPQGVSFSVAFPGSIQTASFNEEQKTKPIETKLLEENDTVLPPNIVAASIIANLENWTFLISPSGINSHLLTCVASGLSPASFSEAVCQVFGSGLIRLIALFMFNRKVRDISERVRR